jgi:hypothetical protein
MNSVNICKVCGGQVAPYDYVCDYCGNVIFENVKTTDDATQGTLHFDEGMDIIKENLNALHDIPKPTFAKSITSALRILVALFTAGIVLIFWRRPKKRFNKDIYNKLKNIILRNISFLKISSKGSNDLMARIKVFEDELQLIDKEIKQGLILKTVAKILSILLFVSWFIYVVNSDPKKFSTYQVVPFDTVARGNISQHVVILPDTAKIRHTKPGELSGWEVDIKLKLKELNALKNKKLGLRVELILTDNKGIAIEGFKPGELLGKSENAFREQLENTNNKESYFRFKISNEFDRSEYMDTIPIEATKFIVRADSLNSN